MPNRLANSSSPYLRQHQDNPVDWYPWGDEAFAAAKEQDKPIFLSVGYSACHWCHVMEHESFENEQLAAILNEHFICIKVDREERPDVDQIYMQAVQMLTGSGGWPMSVFLSPDGQPFYGGTYWPPEARGGHPGFGQVLMAIHDAWINKRAQITEQSAQITDHLQAAARGPEAVEGGVNPAWISQAEKWLVENHDPQYGGLGSAPKFPHAMDLSLLIELEAESPSLDRQQAVQLTLDKMAQGGIYDHLAGGFARYSVDAQWLVPHFEKMLYDNALLAVTYADAFRLWGTPTYAQVVRETLDYILNDMTNPLGAFYSSEDADSEGVEGKFYVWTLAEVQEVLGESRASRFCNIYDVTAAGNFEGENILNLKQPLADRASELKIPIEQLKEDRDKLLARRGQRVRPGLDDKVLLSWNALMITAMTRGYRAVRDPRYLEAAVKATQFIRQHMLRDDGTLWHTWREGQASLDAYLDDYGYFIDALCELYQIAPQEADLQLACQLAEQLMQHFSDPAGGFYFTSDTHETLIARTKDLADTSVPSGNAMAASGLLTLSRLTGRNDFRQAAESALAAASGVLAISPQAGGQSLRTLRRSLKPSFELVLFTGPTTTESAELEELLLRRFDPLSITLSLGEPLPSESHQALCPLLAFRSAINGQPTLYVCRDSVCEQPLTGAGVRTKLSP